VSYASITHVEALNSQRSFTAVSQPNRDEVASLLELTAARLDGIVAARGYAVPVPASAVQAHTVLAAYNAVGAWAYVERSAAASPHADAAWGRVAERHARAALGRGRAGRRNGLLGAPRGRTMDLSPKRPPPALETPTRA
jgi:hypothetical protein